MQEAGRQPSCGTGRRDSSSLSCVQRSPVGSDSGRLHPGAGAPGSDSATTDAAIPHAPGQFLPHSLGGLLGAMASCMLVTVPNSSYLFPELRTCSPEALCFPLECSRHAGGQILPSCCSGQKPWDNLVSFIFQEVPWALPFKHIQEWSQTTSPVVHCSVLTQWPGTRQHQV